MSKKKSKNRNDYISEYSKYKDVPEDKQERLDYVFKILKITERDKDNMDKMIDEIKHLRKTTKKSINMVFYIVPEGISRPRKGRFGFYVPNIKKFYDCMDDYLSIHSDLCNLNIFSECKMDLKYYLPIPSDMRKLEKVLAEMKFIKCIKKPDWDNLGKGSDMFHRLWVDDSLVTDSRVRKYYSFKPRIEVKITYYSTHCNSYHKLCIEKMKKRMEGLLCN